MDYVMVENKKTVLVGPMPWRHRFFQRELIDLDIDYVVSPLEPFSYVKITDSIEIFPVVEILNSEFDPVFEHVSGPYWVFENESARGHFIKHYNDITVIKQSLKSQLAAERYRREILGVASVIQDRVVTITTDRQSRNIMNQHYMLMTEDQVVQWKFPEMWVALTKNSLATAIQGCNQYVQTQFDWEKSLSDSIDIAQTVEELHLIKFDGPIWQTSPRAVDIATLSVDIAIQPVDPLPDNILNLESTDSSISTDSNQSPPEIIEPVI